MPLWRSQPLGQRLPCSQHHITVSLNPLILNLIFFLDDISLDLCFLKFKFLYFRLCFSKAYFKNAFKWAIQFGINVFASRFYGCLVWCTKLTSGKPKKGKIPSLIIPSFPVLNLTMSCLGLKLSLYYRFKLSLSSSWSLFLSSILELCALAT